MPRSFLVLALALLAAFLPAAGAWAGGAPHNVAVLASADRADSMALMRAYAEARGIPDANLCPLEGVPDPLGDPPAPEIDAETYRVLVLEPALACLDASPWAEEIDFLVTLRGLPYHVRGDGWEASLEALLTLGGTTLEGEPLWSALPPRRDRPAYVSPLFAARALYGGVDELRAGRF